MNKILGHYTNLSSLEGILKKNKIRLGSFDKTNDPFENRNFEFSIYQEDINAPGFDSEIFFLSGQQRKPFKLLCFSMSDKIDFFSERPRMWFQYADNHNGCCLIFNKDKFDIEFNKIKMKKINKTKSLVTYNLNKKKREVLSYCHGLSELVRYPNAIVNKSITGFLYKNRKIFLYSKMSDYKEEK